MKMEMKDIKNNFQYFIFSKKQLSIAVLIGYIVNVQVCDAENVELIDTAGLQRFKIIIKNVITFS